MIKRVMLLCGFMSLQACAAVSPTPVYQGGVKGQQFCSKLEEEARDMSTTNASFAWILAGTSLSAVSAGGILTGVNVEKKEPVLGVAGIALIAGGALLVPAAQALFTRADAANILAEAANLGLLKEEDRDAYTHCAAAKGQWVRSRADANNFAVIMLNDQVQKEQAEENARKKAEAELAEKKRIQDAARSEGERKAREEAEKQKELDEARKQLEEAERPKLERAPKGGMKPVVTPAPGVKP